MNGHERFDLNDLLLPLGNKVGAVSRVQNIINEMLHPNTDWKFIVSGIRSYLYDYLHDTVPYHDRVYPIIYHYIREATVRKKASAIRASDTFFDRWLYVLKSSEDGNSDLLPVKRFFEGVAVDYLDLMIRESAEGFYFDSVNDRVVSVGSSVARDPAAREDLLRRINSFLHDQFRLYIRRSMAADEAEIAELRSVIGEQDGTVELFDLLGSVSAEAQKKALDAIEAGRDGSPVGLFARIAASIDFSHNARTWEQICLKAKGLIDQGVIASDEAVLGVLGYLIKKSSEGEDRNLQLFISRTVASMCSVLDRLHKGDLLRSVVDLVLPALLKEIERGGNYYSAFATIFNIGKAVLDSGKIPIIDHFVDLMVKAQFRFPEFSGIASDWSVIVNSSHLENIRTWMRLIELNPPVMKKLAAGLIVNLKLGGVFLKDTDVFQRDISRLLNSDYRDAFYLITSLAAVFPAFYHDIGATGNIRAFTEKIDTNHQMNDLIHFLRKQVHVESSSRTVLLIQRTMDFWMSGEKQLLQNLVPAEVYEYLDRVFRLINLDSEDIASIVYAEVKKRFPEHTENHFWDFLNAVGKAGFLQCLETVSFEGISAEELKDTVNCFTEYFDTQYPAEMTKILHHIRNMFEIDISKTQIWKFLYEVSDEEFRKIFENVRFLDVSRVNVEKFITFLHVYRMIFDKYNFSEVRDVEKLELYARENLFDPQPGLFEKLKGKDLFSALEAVLQLQDTLKWDILLSGRVYEPVDTIEFKRHIAFGIPSMYGSYKERKFDTLKVFFHCNLIRERLFENLLEASSVYPHERLDYGEIKKILALFYRTFDVDGLANHELQSVMSLLDAPNLKISQLRDMVTTLLTIQGEMSDHFNETYKHVCKISITNIGIEHINEQYLPPESQRSVEIVTDRFLRNQIMQSPLLQLFDNLLIRLRDRLAEQMKVRGDVVCLNECDTRREKGGLIFPIARRPGGNGRKELFVPLWLAGSKAQGLVIAANIDGVNVPEGIVLSSELYKRLREGDIQNPRFQRKLIYQLRTYIDRFTGGRFGNPDDPVLLSVRSGAVFSMPGVMTTITNVGLTQEIVDRFALLDGWFAYDCYRRLIHDFAISAYNMDRALFERLMAQAKEEAGVDLKEKLTGGQMEILTKKYRYAVNKMGFSVPKDPYEQLFLAIMSVYRSWESPLATNYRQFVNISDEWGTAVILQKMVFGNQSPLSITGVVHSHYLGHEHIGLFGEYKTRAQGHDIVSGIARVFPISEVQRQNYSASGAMPSLERDYPEHYRKVHQAVKLVRERWGNEVEIEFTFQDDVLYILQIRGMANHIFETEDLFESPETLQGYLLGKGLAASGGAVSGRAVFDVDRIEVLRLKFPGDRVILIRPETNPEDVVGIQRSDGILTCVGGMTSHAVLQMRRLAKSGVSDFSAMKIEERSNLAIVNREGHERGKFIIREGDFLTIDGHTGHVYWGKHETVKKGL